MDYAFEITMILQFLLMGWVIFLLKTQKVGEPTPKQRQFGYVFSGFLGFLALICAYLA